MSVSGPMIAICAKTLAALRQSPLALMMLALGVGLSFGAWHYVGNQTEQKARVQFYLHAGDARDAIVQRVNMHLEILRGARGLFAASTAVTRAEWRDYVAALELARFPGVQGLGFIRYVPAADKEDFERRARRDTSLRPAGHPDFAIFPAGARDDYYPVEYFEAQAPELKVEGLDHGAYPIGREALERARDLGLPAASSRLISVIDQGQKPRFLMVLPVYRNGMPTASVAERRAALHGFVYARFKVEELLNNAIGATLLQELDFEIFDGGLKDAGVAVPDRERLLYDSDDEAVPRALRTDSPPRFSDSLRIEVAGRDWMLHFANLPGATLWADASTQWIVLLWGLLCTYAAVTIVLILSTGRKRVEEEVLRQKSLFAQILDILPINVFIKDQDGRFVMVNAECARLLGLAKEDVAGKSDFDVFPPEVARALRAYDTDVRAADGLVMREEKLVSGGKELFALAGKTMITLAGNAQPLLLGFSIDISERKKMEQSLLESEERFRSILDNATAVIYIKDLEGRFILINRQYEKLFHTSNADMLGKTDYDIFPKELADAYRENDRRVLAGRKAVEFEEQAQQDDGLHTYVSVKFPLFGVSGEPYALCGISTDISERLQLEREAAEVRGNQLSRTLIDAVGEGVIGVDLLHRVVFANPKAQELLGMGEAKMLGWKLDDVVRVVTAEGCHLTDDTCPAWAAVAAGHPFRSDDWRFTRNDGNLFPVQMSIEPVYDGGKHSGAVLSFQDITWRKGVEAALAEVERQQKAFLENLPELAWLKDKDSRFILVNEATAKACGVPLEEIRGKTDLDFWPTDLAERYRADDREIMASGRRKRVEEPFEGQDGTRIWIETIKSPVYDEKGRVIGTVGTARDITQRKHDEAELKRHIAELARMNAELDEFSYIASHDLQEPLRKMISFSDWLRRDLGDDLSERAAKDLSFIMDAAGRMQALVQDLLALSRTGKTSMVHEWVKLDEAADRALDALALRIAETGATIARDPLPEVWGDPSLLAQLYQNLVGNALKFVGAAPPHIHLTTEPLDGEWVFGVRDNGIGIKPEYAEQIFLPFKRLHGRGEYEGSGIGLAVCRKVVERHHGRIWVESAEGQGAHFKFVLPDRDGRQ